MLLMLVMVPILLVLAALQIQGEALPYTGLLPPPFTT